MKKGTYYKAVVILDKESSQCLLDNCKHVWTGGCSQGIFYPNAALMYLASDFAL